MRNKLSNALWGLFFVIIGIGFAGNVMDLWKFELFFDGWWTFLIIIPCFISMIQSGFGVASTTGFIIGVLLFISSRVDFNFSVWELIIPAILVFIGVRLLFQGAFRKKPNFNYENINVNMENDGSSNFNQYAKTEHSAVFSSNRIHVTDVFTRTDINAIFGGLVLDLRDAHFVGDAEITATAVFGGIDIYVPNGIHVKVNNVPIFGGVSNKTSYTADPSAPTIYLNSTCMFGGIDIK